ncbi:MAG TPA: MFS transporter [Myxococcota bacterium]|nr:MFS transporter [Myxococcota bacterium]
MVAHPVRDFLGHAAHAVTQTKHPVGPPAGSRQSRIALNATNFFLAEVVTVVVPFLSDYLRDQKWHYDQIGMATSMAGFGVLLAETPVGLLIDRILRRRRILAITAVLVGLCFGAIPLVPAEPTYINALMFFAGINESFFTPLLGALALALAGRRGFNKMMGVNQAWNHVGSIVSAVAAMGIVAWAGVHSVFYGLAAVSFFSASCVMLIRRDDLHEPPRGAKRDKDAMAKLRAIFKDRRVPILLACTALFHIANAPVMPLVALNMRRHGGSSTQIAAMVLIAQGTMVAVAWAASILGDRWGRKPVLAIGYVVLPIRILLYTVVESPTAIMAIQVLDGMGAGIYGVITASICSDLAGKQGRFNTLMGIVTTALASGTMFGPMIGGQVVEHLGFKMAFLVLACVGAAGAALFVTQMPETADDQD